MENLIRIAEFKSNCEANKNRTNIAGTADVIRELTERVKAQANAEAQQAEEATETPQISTETANVV